MTRQAKPRGSASAIPPGQPIGKASRTFADFLLQKKKHFSRCDERHAPVGKKAKARRRPRSRLLCTVPVGSTSLLWSLERTRTTCVHDLLGFNMGSLRKEALVLLRFMWRPLHLREKCTRSCRVTLSWSTESPDLARRKENEKANSSGRIPCTAGSGFQ